MSLNIVSSYDVLMKNRLAFFRNLIQAKNEHSEDKARVAITSLQKSLDDEKIFVLNVITKLNKDFPWTELEKIYGSDSENTISELNSAIRHLGHKINDIADIYDDCHKRFSTVEYFDISAIKILLRNLKQNLSYLEPIFNVLKTCYKNIEKNLSKKNISKVELKMFEKNVVSFLVMGGLLACIFQLNDSYWQNFFIFIASVCFVTNLQKKYSKPLMEIKEIQKFITSL